LGFLIGLALVVALGCILPRSPRGFDGIINYMDSSPVRLQRFNSPSGLSCFSSPSGLLCFNSPSGRGVDDGCSSPGRFGDDVVRSPLALLDSPNRVASALRKRVAALPDAHVHNRALGLVRCFFNFFFPQVFRSLLLLIRVLSSYNFRVYSVAWSPDGKQIASGSEDNTIKIWDSQSGDCQLTLCGPYEE